MMTYAHFRAQGYPIGSGCVESANKLVVESRMKGAGMRWAAEHVNPMLALRNIACSNRWKASWKQIRQHLIIKARAKRADVSAQRLKLRADRQKEIIGDNLSDSINKIQEEQMPLAVAPQEMPVVPVTQNILHIVNQGQTIPPDLLVKQEESPTCNTRPAPNHPWRRPLIRQRPAS